MNLVLVPVVVRDAKGRAISTLQKENFRLFDDGKVRAITGFAVEKAQPPANSASASVSAERNMSGPPHSAPTPDAGPQRFIVLMFDDMHLNAAEAMRVQEATTKALAASSSRTDMFAVLTTSGSNSGLTRDHAALYQAIRSVKARALTDQSATQCPNVGYYEANLIVNESDQGALNTATQDAMVCASLNPGSPTDGMAKQMALSAARSALMLGDEDIRLSLGFLTRVVRGMGRLPGQRVLVLISPGFPAVTHEDLSVTSGLLNAAAESDVTIDTTDVRGLSSNLMSVTESGSTAIETHSKLQYGQATVLAGEDLMSALADGTGGTFFHNSNDLQGGFARVQAPDCVYVLQFSLNDVERDGTYHRLTVKVDQPGWTVQARRGYFAAEPQKSAN